MTKSNLTAAEYLTYMEADAEDAVAHMSDDQLGLAEEQGAMQGHDRLAEIASEELCKRIATAQAASKAIGVFAVATIQELNVRLRRARTLPEVHTIFVITQDAYYRADGCMTTPKRELKEAFESFVADHANVRAEVA